MSATQPRLVFHVLPPSHPCMTVEAALRLKGLEYETVDLHARRAHRRRWRGSTARGSTTVPGLLVDGEPVHGSRRDPRAPRGSWPPSRRCTPGRSPTRSATPSAGATRSCRTSAAGCPGARCTSGPRRWAPSGAAARWIPPGPTSRSRYVPRLLEVPRHHRACASPTTSRACPPSSTASTRSPPRAIVGGDEPNAADLQIGATLRCCCRRRPAPADRGPPGGPAGARWFDDRPGRSPPARSRPAGCPRPALSAARRAGRRARP